MRISLAVGLALVAGAVRAEPLTDARAFDRAFASSFYLFDACGDGKHGLLFRNALAARFAQCPFTPEARKAHGARNRMQADRSHDKMNDLIDQTGGVPVRLPEMIETCRQYRAGPDYVVVRDKLDRYSEGAAKPEEVIPSACDADTIAP